VLTTATLLATDILARAGSGSSGFSRGGGGFSGSRGSGGGGIVIFGGGGGGGGGGVLLVLILLVVVAVAIPILLAAYRKHQRARARQIRHLEVTSAAAAAADDDEAFDADRLIADTAAMAVAIQQAWDDQDRSALARMLGPDLLREWTLRLDDFARRRWADRVKVTGKPEIRLVSLINRADDVDDRVVVHITMSIDNWVDTPFGPQFPTGQESPQTELSEYWTLGKRDGRWILLSIEQELEGEHHLNAPIVVDPTADPELSDRSRTELATSSATDLDHAELVSLASTGFSDDARAAALDLSLVDDRFSPDVLQIAVNRAVAAWATAIDGADDDLERLADPDAVRILLYGPDATQRTRTVVRGPRVEDLTIDAVTGTPADEGNAVATATASMQVQVHYRARWYREDRETAAVLEGSKDRETERTDRWTFALTDDAEHPWRLVAVAA
jgi:predicted lipid-binding transport protein (Tim44 family)